MRQANQSDSNERLGGRYEVVTRQIQMEIEQLESVPIKLFDLRGKK
jgi:hypothetical protein